MIAPYDFQIRVMSDIAAGFRAGHRGALVVMPTGSGKTLTFCTIAMRAAVSGVATLILVPRQELVSQTSATISAFGVRHGVIAAGWTNPDPRALIQVASIQTLYRRPNLSLPKFGIVMVDEAHLARAATFQATIERFSGARLILWTATPYRTDGKGFEDLASFVVQGPSVARLVELGRLSPFTAYSIPLIDTSKLKISAGDFDLTQQSDILRDRILVGDVVGHYHTLAAGRPFLAFASGIDHSRDLAAEFNRSGVRAAHLDGAMASDVRSGILDALRTGAIDGVVNFGVLTEGFDCPRVSAVIIDRATTSPALFVQMAGRGIRTCDGKRDAVIIDHGGNAARFGNLDYPRVPSLFGRPKSARDAEPGLLATVCANCSAIMPASAPACTVCGEAFTRPVAAGGASGEPDRVAGELVPVAAGAAPVDVGRAPVAAAARSAIVAPRQSRASAADAAKRADDLYRRISLARSGSSV
jgi:DNA repair protein RadD